MSKADRRARKKANKRAGELRCENCDAKVPDGPPAPVSLGEIGVYYWYGIHDTAWSMNDFTWDGMAVVAFCQWCGHEYASNGLAVARAME